MPTINKRGIDTIMSWKKKIAAAFIACAMTLAVVPSAFACTALYVGSDLTEDGTTMFGRIEDLGTNDYNKLFNISPAGKHTAGEVPKSYHVENGVWQKLKIVLYLFNVIQLNKVGVRYFSFVLFVCPSDMMRYIGCITSEFQYGNNIRLYRVTYHQ